jgi:hypothetical protein
MSSIGNSVSGIEPEELEGSSRLRGVNMYSRCFVQRVERVKFNRNCRLVNRNRRDPYAEGRPQGTDIGCHAVQYGTCAGAQFVISHDYIPPAGGHYSVTADAETSTHIAMVTAAKNRYGTRLASCVFREFIASAGTSFEQSK